MTVAPTQSDVFLALGSFLEAVLPSVNVVQGQANRVPSPKVQNFAVMTPTRRGRLETNVDDPADAAFTASIVGSVMSVSTVRIGSVEVGATVFGSGVSANTTVTGTLGSSGGTGTYTVSPPQALTSRPMAAGRTAATQNTMVTIQVDVHGPDGADNAQTITTLLRDGYGFDFFAATGTGVVPLYADDPRQVPFETAEKQYEDRWIVEVQLQVNAVVRVPQQYADAATVEIIDVDAAYPPS